MAKYSKLLASLAGSVIAIVLVYLGSKGLATCVPGPTPDSAELCSIAGFSTSQITGAVTMVISAIAVYFAPKNDPAS